MSEDIKRPGRPGVYRGDVVYFDHPAGPRSGRVLAHGQHGCTIECKGGQRYKVKWENVLGHKKRATLHYKVVEEGEDGMILEDADGQRRFVGVETPDAPERVVVRGAKPKKTPKNAAPREIPKHDKAVPKLRKSEYFPKILLWSR